MKLDIDHTGATSDASRLLVCVFSHNRGSALDECLKSVVANAQGSKVAVFDDGSRDPTTLAVLDRWSKAISVFRNPKEEGWRIGGLHSNMNRAIEVAVSEGAEYTLMLQDDMQIVRTILPQDHSNFATYFAHNPTAVELSVSFWPFDRRGSGLNWHLDESGVASLSKHEKYQAGYSDTGLFHVGQFIHAWSRFEKGEWNNVLKARTLGSVRALYRYPFTMFMPFPRTYRGGRRGPTTIFTEWLAGSGLHPFDPMTDIDVRGLFARSDPTPAVARDWLNCPTIASRPLWSYYGGPTDLRARLGWRGVLGTLLGGKEPQFREESVADTHE